MRATAAAAAGQVVVGEAGNRLRAGAIEIDRAAGDGVTGAGAGRERSGDADRAG